MLVFKLIKHKVISICKKIMSVSPRKTPSLGNKVRGENKYIKLKMHDYQKWWNGKELIGIVLIFFWHQIKIWFKTSNKYINGFTDIILIRI